MAATPILTQPFCRLLNTVINRFDDTLAIRAPTGLHLPHFECDKQKEVDTFMQNAHIPTEIRVHIVTQVDNVAEFVLLTRIFNPYKPEEDQVDLPGIAQESAKTLLKKFGHPTGWVAGHIYSPVEQLFGHVFWKAFAEASPEGKREIIDLTKPMEPIAEKSYTSFQKTMIRIEHAVAVVTGNVVFRWGTSIAAGYVAWKAYGYGRDYFRTYILPRGVNYLINHASLTVIKGINKTWKVCDTLLAYQGLIWIPFTILNWVPQFRQGPVNRVLTLANRVLTFPKTVVETVAAVPSKIFWRALSLSTAAQQKVSTDLANIKQRSEAQLIERECRQAYRVWMQCIKEITFAPVSV